MVATKLHGGRKMMTRRGGGIPVCRDARRRRRTVIQMTRSYWRPTMVQGDLRSESTMATSRCEKMIEAVRCASVSTSTNKTKSTRRAAQVLKKDRSISSRCGQLLTNLKWLTRRGNESDDESTARLGVDNTQRTDRNTTEVWPRG